MCDALKILAQLQSKLELKQEKYISEISTKDDQISLQVIVAVEVKIKGVPRSLAIDLTVFVDCTKKKLYFKASLFSVDASKPEEFTQVLLDLISMAWDHWEKWEWIAQIPPTKLNTLPKELPLLLRSSCDYQDDLLVTAEFMDKLINLDALVTELFRFRGDS
jgi:hypothetical protein